MGEKTSQVGLAALSGEQNNKSDEDCGRNGRVLEIIRWAQEVLQLGISGALDLLGTANRVEETGDGHGTPTNNMEY